jgi:hypothetical protein
MNRIAMLLVFLSLGMFSLTLTGCSPDTAPERDPAVTPAPVQPTDPDVTTDPYAEPRTPAEEDAEEAEDIADEAEREADEVSNDL